MVRKRKRRNWWGVDSKDKGLLMDTLASTRSKAYYLMVKRRFNVSREKLSREQFLPYLIKCRRAGDRLIKVAISWEPYGER